MNDTIKSVEQRYNEMLLSQTPLERLKMVSRMYDTCKKLVITGIQNSGKQPNAHQLRAQLFLRLYGNDFMPANKEKILAGILGMQLDTDSHSAG